MTGRKGRWELTLPLLLLFPLILCLLMTFLLQIIPLLPYILLPILLFLQFFLLLLLPLLLPRVVMDDKTGEFRYKSLCTDESVSL